MKSFLDTSVLVAAFHVEHPHHQPSFDLLVRCQKSDACCGLHSLAEVYGTLTGMRVASRRASGDQALLFISNIRERFTLVGLDEQEYFQMLDDSATVGILGGPSMTRSSDIARSRPAPKPSTPGTRKIFCDCAQRSPAA